MSEDKRDLTLDELTKKAFPDPNHPVQLLELRKFLYVLKFAEEENGRRDYTKTLEHVITCSSCQREIGIMMAIDSNLNGEDEKGSKVLIEVIDNK